MKTRNLVCDNVRVWRSCSIFKMNPNLIDDGFPSLTCDVKWWLHCNTMDESILKIKTTEMVEKDSSIRIWCSVNYGMFSLNVLYWGQVDWFLCGGFSYAEYLRILSCPAFRKCKFVKLLCCPLFFQNGHFLLSVQGSVKYVSQQAKQYAHYRK